MTGPTGPDRTGPDPTGVAAGQPADPAQGAAAGAEGAELSAPGPEPVDGGLAAGAVVDGGPADGGPAEGGPAEGEPAEAGATDGGVTEGGVVPAVTGEPARRGRWPEPGPVAEEAARLAEAAGDWARRAVPELAAVLRGDRPEVTGKLAEAGAAVAAAARAVLDTLVRPPAGKPGQAPEPGAEPPAPPGPRVEPIDVE